MHTCDGGIIDAEGGEEMMKLVPALLEEVGNVREFLEAQPESLELLPSPERFALALADIPGAQKRLQLLNSLHSSPQLLQELHIGLQAPNFPRC